MENNDRIKRQNGHSPSRRERQSFSKQKERYLRKYFHIAPEDFAGGGKSGTYRYSYPCDTPGRCRAALAYARYAPRPEIIRKRVMRIAKRKGFINPKTGKLKMH